MPATVDPALLDRLWRPSASWELVLADRAEATEQALLARLGGDSTFYGLLRPVGDPPGRSLRAVDRELALLLLTLARTPGPIPAYARRPDPAQTAQGLAALALDGVLEISEDAGTWRTGGAVLEILTTKQGPDGGALARLSRAALRHAAALDDDDPLAAAGRLYRFGVAPLPPAALRRLGQDLPDAARVLSWLGLGPRGARRGALERHWRLPTGAREGWLPFESRSPGRPAEGPTWKLYFSPLLPALPGALETFAATIARHGSHAWKLGADLAGLLRPDKAVAYFGSFEGLAAAGHELAERLDGVPAQGVPFTAPLETAGLLSWGVDPPAAESLPWWGRQSWRLWVSHRLGSALVAARADSDPVATALARLALEGLDVDRWTPSLGLWSTPEGSSS